MQPSRSPRDPRWPIATLLSLLLLALVPAALAQEESGEEEGEPEVATIDMANPEKAAKKFQEAIQKDPTQAQNYFNLGQAYVKLRKWSDAAQTLKKYNEMEAGNAKGLYFQGFAQIKSGDPQGAFPVLEKVVAMTEDTPDDPVAVASRSALGDAYVKAKQWDKAIAMYETTLSSGGAKVDTASIYNNLGHIYAKKGDTQKAVEYFKKASKEDPGSAVGQYNLGVIFYNLGQKTRDGGQKAEYFRNAHDAFSKAYELSPRDNLDALYLAGETAAFTGQAFEAKEKLQLYLKSAPEGKFAPDARKLLEGL